MLKEGTIDAQLNGDYDGTELQGILGGSNFEGDFDLAILR